MSHSESTEDNVHQNVFGYTTLRIRYSDNREIVQAITALQPDVKVLAIDSRLNCPDFLTCDEFYLAIQRKHNVFIVDVNLNDEAAFVDETVFMQKLDNIDKHLIIQCGTLACTRIFVKEPGKQVQILDLNSPDLNKPMTEDELINRLKNKATFGIALLVDVAKQGLYGEFRDKPGHHRSLANASFAVEKALGSRDNFVMPSPQPEIRSDDYCNLMDCAVLIDDFLTVRLLSLHSWELSSLKHEVLSTLEIAAKHSSPLILATLFCVDLPIPFGNVKLPKNCADLLHLCNYPGNNTPLLTAAKAGKYDNVDFLIRCGMDVNACSKDGKTCLWYVVAASKWEMAKCLLERGARITCLTPDQKIDLLESILGFKLTYDHSTDIKAILYSTIRINNADLLKFLFDKWQEGVKDNPVMTQNIDECLCKVYEELKLKNVPLSMEVQFVAEDKIIQAKFFIEKTSENQSDVKATLDGVKKRIDMVVKGIKDLNTKCSGENTKDVNGQFLLKARFICQNIHVLKRQLKSSCRNLPWEQIEFCLANFVANCAKLKEFDVCKLVLDEERILFHLRHFAMELDEVNVYLTEDINIEVPNLRSKSSFKELCADYDLMKDVYSLKRIEAYVKVAVRVNLDERKDVGKLVIERTLQVIGESLKSTDESPNVSNHIRKMLLSSASANLKYIITVLRDSLSHAHTLKSRLELEDSKSSTLFEKVHNDLIKIDRDISYILYKNQADAINMYLDRIIKMNGLQRAKHMVGRLKMTKLEEIELELGNTSEWDTIKKLVCELLHEVKDKTPEEQDYLGQIHKIVESQCSRRKSAQHSFIIGLNALKTIGQRSCNNDIIELIKSFYQNFVTLMEEVQHPPDDLIQISCLFNCVCRSMKQRNQDIYLPKVMRTAANVLDIYNLGEVRVRGIDHFTERLQKGETDVLRKAETNIARVLNEIKCNIGSEADKNKFEEVAQKKRKFYVAKQDFIDFVSRLMAGEDVPEEPERQKYRNSLELLELKKGKLKDLQQQFVKGNWGACKSLVGNSKDSYQTLLDSVKNSVEGENHEMSSCFKVFVNSLGFAKSLKTELLEAIDNLFKPNEQLQNYFYKRLAMLNLLIPDKDCLEFVQKLKQDKEMQIAIEMLVLDLTEICNNIAMFADNRLFMDTYSPVLMGKSLRNYLAHGDALIDILPFDPSVAIISNAFRFIEEGRTLVTNENCLVGQRIVENHLVLSDRYHASLGHINLQNEMFISAKEGDVGAVQDYINQGADVKARDVDNSTVVHFAAQGKQQGNVQVLKYCLDQKLCVDIEDDYCQNPLYVAVTHGSICIVRYLLEELHLRVNDVDHNDTLPLTIAAKYGHNDIAELLLCSGANISKTTSAYRSPLLYAAQFGHREVFLTLLDAFLEKHMIVNVGDSSGWTPLHYAVVLGHNDIVIDLINKGSQVNAASVDRQMTPLHLAVQNGRKAIAETLLDNYANIDQETDDKRTPLHLTAEYGNSEVVKLLLQQNANINATDKEDFTALHIAACAGNQGVVKALLKCNAMVEAQNRDLCTPLHIAARYGYKGIVDALLDHGASVNAKNKYDEVPLHFAARYGLTNVVMALLNGAANTNAEDLRKRTPLHHAAHNGYTAIITALLDKGAVVDSRDNRSRTPLHLASEKGKNEAVASLLLRNADVDAADVRGTTPLHMAILHCHLDVVDALLKKGADVNRKTEKGEMTPLHLSLLFGRDAAAVKILNERADVDVNVLNLSMSTPLQLAAWVGNKDIVSSLLMKKAQVDVADIEMMTPLHFAAKYGHEEIAHYLVEGKANVDAVNKSNLTPLHLASGNGHKGIVVALLKRKANVGAVNESLVTPLHFAAGNGHKEVVIVLLEGNANVDAVDKDLETPLHLAARVGYTDVVYALLEGKANVDVVNHNNFTPLHLAAGNGHKETVCALLEGKANVDAADENNLTPLHLAAWKGYKEIVNVLIEGKANVDAVNKSNSTPLHFAAKEGHKEIVITLLEGTANVDAVNDELFTPLHFAAWKGYKNIVNALLEGKANVDAGNKDNFTPLHFAAQEGNKEVVIALLEGKANVDVVDENNFTPLHSAAGNGHKEVVIVLLEGNANANAADKDMETPLHLAARAGNTDMVYALLEGKANVDAVNENTFTPLHLAAGNGHKETVCALLEGKANVDAADENNLTPLHLAAGNGHKEVVIALLEGKTNVDVANENNSTPLHIAAINGHTEVVIVLLERNANANAADKDMETPLHLAAQVGYTDMVYAILEGKANVDAVNKDNFTPLHLAAQEGNKEVVIALLQGKANVEAVNEYNFTPLHIAAGNGHNEVVIALLEGNANVNSISQSSCTPLHLAAREGHLEVVNTLLERKANVDAVNNNKFTPLHLAVGNGHHKVVVVLLEGNANVDAADKDMETPLHLAARVGYKEIVNALLESKANVDAVNENLFTPLHLATGNGHWEICSYLLDEGADFLARNNHDTILHRTVNSGNAIIVQMILDRIQDRFSKGTEEWYEAVNAKDGEGYTPLMWAAEKSLVHVAKLLVEQADADVHATDDCGKMVLHWAVKSGQLELVRWLVDEKGAAVSAADLDGKTPLDLAENDNHKEIVEFLKSRILVLI